MERPRCKKAGAHYRTSCRSITLQKVSGNINKKERQKSGNTRHVWAGASRCFVSRQESTEEQRGGEESLQQASRPRRCAEALRECSNSPTVPEVPAAAAAGRTRTTVWTGSELAAEEMMMEEGGREERRREGLRSSSSSMKQISPGQRGVWGQEPNRTSCC